MKRLALAASAAALSVASFAGSAAAQVESYEGLINMHAAANGVPASLVRRVMMRESRGRAHAVSRGNYGLMQIRLQTARGMGYTGNAAGLLDPNTNMTYAVKYLAGAYRAAGGNENRAVAYYASGYYYAAKRQRLKDQSRVAMAGPTFNPFATDVSGARKQRYAALPLTTQQDATAFGVSPTPPAATRHTHRVSKRAVAQNAVTNPFAALFALQKKRR
jgi:soluble lytic murein transglycosylase-like protein